MRLRSAPPCFACDAIGQPRTPSPPSPPSHALARPRLPSPQPPSLFPFPHSPHHPHHPSRRAQGADRTSNTSQTTRAATRGSSRPARRASATPPRPLQTWTSGRSSLQMAQSSGMPALTAPCRRAAQPRAVWARAGWIPPRRWQWRAPSGPWGPLSAWNSRQRAHQRAGWSPSTASASTFWHPHL